MERNQCPSYCMLFHNLVCLNSTVSISTRIMYGQLGSKVKDIHKNKWNKVLINLLFVFIFFSQLFIYKTLQEGQWVVHLTHNHSIIMGKNLVKGFRCFLEQETLPSLLSPGLFQGWIQA